MFKTVGKKVCVFDVECVPSVRAGRMVYGLPTTLSDDQVREELWSRARRNEDNPRPFLKPVLTQVVTISALLWRGGSAQPRYHLLSLPDLDKKEQPDEATIIGNFLQIIGDRSAQLIGYNSRGFDLPLLLQRATILGIQAETFCKRPEKPWEGVDYFSRGGESHIDLMELLAAGAWGSNLPSLHELAVQSGIPGKMDISGYEVVDLWMSDKYKQIQEYNDFDAISTFLLWLRVAHLGGHFSTESYIDEQLLLKQYLEELSQRVSHSHLLRYLKEWQRLSPPDSPLFEEVAL